MYIGYPIYGYPNILYIYTCINIRTPPLYKGIYIYTRFARGNRCVGDDRRKHTPCFSMFGLYNPPTGFGGWSIIYIYLYMWRIRREVYPLSYLSPRVHPSSSRNSSQSLVAIFHVFPIVIKRAFCRQRTSENVRFPSQLWIKQIETVIFYLFYSLVKFPFFSLCNRSCNTNCNTTVIIWLKQHGFMLLFSITT